MTRIPFLFTWYALFAGYLPYSMSLAYLNPLLIMAFSFLSWPLAASFGRAWPAIAVCTSTLLLGWGVANLVTGTPQFVLPHWAVVLASFCLISSAAFGAVQLRKALEGRGWPAEKAQTWLRAGFFVAAVLVYFNAYLPYDWKMWIADRTTSMHLVGFAMTTSALFAALFVGTWRMTK
ncbi:MAG: hypothetical protein OHK0021_00940 [Bryobacter sp.]